jgi:REP element-mobilizing transposase RayT
LKKLCEERRNNFGAGLPSGRYHKQLHHPTRQHRHLAHIPSFRDNPVVFVTTGTHQRKKLLANAQCHEILREIWARSMVIDGWCVGHYILMPDHVHLFARPAIDARPMADWIKNVEER